MTNEDLPFCECGCGKRVSKVGNRFIIGHHGKGVPRTSEHCTALSAALMGHSVSDKTRAKMSTTRKKAFVDGKITLPIRKGVTLSSETRKKMSDAQTGVPKPPRTSEHCTAMSQSIRNSDAAHRNYDSMKGGNDIVNHHYTYDHSDLTKNTIKMTRSDHMKLHHLLRKLGYIVPHINIKD